MKDSPQKAKLGMLKLWSSKHFANKALFILSGLEDLLKDGKDTYIIDQAYDLVAPELSTENNQKKPSKALAAIAFSRPINPTYYQQVLQLIKSTPTGSVAIRQFLMQDIDHQPPEKVIDHFTFPKLAEIVYDLEPEDKVKVLLSRPQIIHNTPNAVRFKTLKDLLTSEELTLLRQNAPEELKVDLCCNLNTTDTSKVKIDKHFVQETQAHWNRLIRARKNTPQTGFAQQMNLWKQRHNIKD